MGRLVAGVLMVAGAARAPLVATDVKVVQVEVAIAEVGRQGPFLDDELRVVTIETQAIGRLVERRVEVLREGVFQNVIVMRSVCLMAGDAIVLANRPVHEFGAFELGRDVENRPAAGLDRLVVT